MTKNDIKNEIIRLCRVIFHWDNPTDLGEYLKTIEFFAMFKQGSLQDALDSIKEIRYYAGSMDTLDEIKDVLDDLEKLLKKI